MYDVIKNVLKVSWAVVWKWIGIPLISTIVAIFVIGRLIDSFSGPKIYNVYLVGDFSNDEYLEKLKIAFFEPWYNKYKGAGLEIGGIKIDFKSQDVPEKEAERVAAKLANGNDTLMVIGHLTSTATKRALPYYLNAEPPIPVIMADETNPQLLPPDYNTKYYPMFRLSPTDEEQARRAAKFAFDHGAKAIWVVEDAITNTVYSNYLAQAFVKKIHELRFQSKVLLWTTNRESPSAEAVKALGINWVFFAGSWSSGLILTRQIKEIWKNRATPSILLSNACANLELLREGGSDMKGVYLIHQMLAIDFDKEGSAFWGTLASQLTIKLIQGAGNDFEKLSKRKRRAIVHCTPNSWSP